MPRHLYQLRGNETPTKQIVNPSQLDPTTKAAQQSPNRGNARPRFDKSAITLTTWQYWDTKWSRDCDIEWHVGFGPLPPARRVNSPV